MKNWRVLISVLAMMVSTALAIVLAMSGVLHQLLDGVRDADIVASVVGGVMFSSYFTVPLSLVVLAESAQEISPWYVAFLGAFGAVLGDYVMFFLFRRGARSAIVDVYKHAGGKMPRGRLLQRYGWLASFLGMLIIASPFPDEIGIALIGVTNAPVSRFLVIAFAGNFIGILLLGLAGRALA